MNSNPLDAYLDVFEEIRGAKRWGESTDIYRLAALTLSGQDLDGLGERLGATSEALRKCSGWNDPLRTWVRHAIAALILERDLDPVQFHAGVTATRKTFRSRRMRRGNIFEVLAACLLVSANAGAHAAPEAIDRLEGFLAEWKRAHKWLTGPDDYPMAALHALMEGDVVATSARIEAIYAELRRARFSASNGTQLASHLLAIQDGDPVDAVERFVTLRRLGKAAGLPVSSFAQSDVAVLSLVPGEPETLIGLAGSLRDGLRASPRRPNGRLAGTLAMGIVSHEALRQMGRSEVSTASVVPALQMIVTAQATVAMMAGAMVAASAAAS